VPAPLAPFLKSGVNTFANVQCRAYRLSELEDVAEVKLQPTTVERIEPACAHWFKEHVVYAIACCGDLAVDRYHLDLTFHG
jgi:hypothetical protein